MFRALLCSSSGSQNCIIQYLVSSHSVGGRPVNGTATYHHHHHHHHHKHQGLDPLIRSVSTVTAARTNASSVFQLFSFLVVCSMISKGFGFVAGLGSTLLHKTGMFGGLEVSYHQTYSVRDWLSILRTPYLTQNLQRKHRTDSQITTKAIKLVNY